MHTKLRTLRDMLDLPRNRMAALLAVPYPTYKQYESSRSRMPASFVQSVGHYLGHPAAMYLLGFVTMPVINLVGDQTFIIPKWAYLALISGNTPQDDDRKDALDTFKVQLIGAGLDSRPLKGAEDVGTTDVHDFEYGECQCVLANFGVIVMNAKYLELEGLELQGFKPFYVKEVLDDGEVKKFFEVSKKVDGGWLHIKGFASELEQLIELGMSDTNEYEAV